MKHLRFRLLFLFTAITTDMSDAQTPECRVGILCEDCSCGPCDDPQERDAWDLVTFSSRDPMMICIRFVILQKQSGTITAATQQQVNDQFGRLTSVFEDYEIAFERGMNDTFVSNETHYDFCYGAGECFCDHCYDDCWNDMDPDPIGATAWEGELKYALAQDTDEMMKIYVTDMSNAGGPVGIGLYPWCPFRTDELGGIFIDKEYFGGQDCGPQQ